jgi:hypothetical protein
MNFFNYSSSINESQNDSQNSRDNRFMSKAHREHRGSPIALNSEIVESQEPLNASTRPSNQEENRNDEVNIQVDQPSDLNEANSHLLRGPSNATEPEFESAKDDPKLYLVSALTEYPSALNQILGPLKQQISSGIRPSFDESLKIAPKFQGQLKEEFLTQIYTLSTTKEGRKKLSEQIRDLDLMQINILMFHICRIGDVKTLRVLAEVHNLDFNLMDSKGRTAVFFAAIGNHKDCLKILVKNGSMIELIDSSGRTPLMWACYYACVDTAQYLRKKSNVFHEDFQKRTSLHYSTFPEDSKTLKLILRALKKQGIDFLDEEQMVTFIFIIITLDTIDVGLFLWKYSECQHIAQIQIKRISPSIAYIFITSRTLRGRQRCIGLLHQTNIRMLS